MLAATVHLGLPMALWTLSAVSLMLADLAS